MCFHRKIGDFKQTILINSSTNTRFTDGIGYISIHLFYNSPKIEKMASVLVDAKSNFEKVNIVLNINSGFISGKEAVSFDLCSVDNLPDIFNLDDLPFKEILSFLFQKREISVRRRLRFVRKPRATELQALRARRLLHRAGA